MPRLTKMLPASLMISTLCFSAVSQAQTPPSEEALIKESRGAIMALGKQLKGTVKKAVKEKGLTGAIESCQLKAPEIAEAVSAEHQISVGRTSEKWRNPENAPDAWEQKVLASFEQRLAAGEEAKTLDHGEMVKTEDGKQVFRYMKAISAGKVCLNCHGANIKADVQKTLNERYPEDKATGFSLGDLRGAFTVVKSF